MSAEHSLLENTGHEKHIQKKGPKVMATQNDLDLEAITKYRAQELQSEQFDDFNFHEKIHSGPKKFDTDRIQN